MFDVEDRELEPVEEELEDEVVIEIKPSKFICGILGVASFLCVLSGIYLNSLYVPEDRVFDSSNLFSNNSVIVDSSTAESICCSLEDEFDIELDYENDNSLLLNAIYCNKNLSDDEKSFCIKYLELFDDNPYLDKDRVYHSLLNLDISNKNRPPYYDKNVEGVYIDDLKSIGIFVDDEDDTVKAHELIHCICANDGELPRFFREGVTELLTNEYFTENHFLELDNYPFEVIAVKMLCDATSSDTVLKAFTLGDMSYIYESLASSYGSVEDAKKAITILDNAFSYRSDDENEFNYTGDDVANYFFGYLNGVVFNKYDEGSAERASFFYNEILLLNLFESSSFESFMEDLEEYGLLCKAYFSSKLKEEYPHLVITKFEDTVVINSKDFQKTKVLK